MIEINVVGTQAVIARLQAMPLKVKTAVKQEMTAQAVRLVSYIQLKKLVGGNPLHQRSGRLSASVKYNVMDVGDGSGFVVSAGNNSNVKYAAIHEFGYSGSESVKAHTRTITQAFGRTIAPKTVQVSAFTRRMNMPERSFMRSSLAENMNQIRLGLQAAVRGALHA